MTEQQARTAANILMAAAAAGTALTVLRTPRVRRLAWQLARSWARGPLALWAATELRKAWELSGRPG